jgi:hypothetical protein
VFDRIAVISRDEPAMRSTRAVREHNAAHASRTRVIDPRTDAEWWATFSVPPTRPGCCARPLATPTWPRGTAAARRGGVRSEKLGEVTAEFETIHDVARPRQVSSVHDIIPAVEGRPRPIAAVERGIEPAGRT